MLRKNKIISQFLRFMVTSGLGWFLAMTILWVLVKYVAISIFWANWAGDLVAVTYVYCVSVRKIFWHDGNYLKLKFVVWIVYTAFMINLASVFTNLTGSFMVNAALLASRPVAALAAKVLITPFSLALNFFVARFLLERFGRPAGVVGPTRHSLKS